eukprot:423812-Hanusia_phi.AAC.1
MEVCLRVQIEICKSASREMGVGGAESTDGLLHANTLPSCAASCRCQCSGPWASLIAGTPEVRSSTGFVLDCSESYRARLGLAALFAGPGLLATPLSRSPRSLPWLCVCLPVRYSLAVV